MTDKGGLGRAAIPSVVAWREANPKHSHSGVLGYRPACEVCWQRTLGDVLAAQVEWLTIANREFNRRLDRAEGERIAWVQRGERAEQWATEVQGERDDMRITAEANRRDCLAARREAEQMRDIAARREAEQMRDILNLPEEPPTVLPWEVVYRADRDVPLCDSCVVKLDASESVPPSADAPVTREEFEAVRLLALALASPWSTGTRDVPANRIREAAEKVRTP